MCCTNCNCKQSVGGQAATAQKGEPMSGRYKAVPETTNNRRLVYVVIDTLTGEWMHVYDCFLWAEKKSEELNRSQAHERAFNTERGTDGHKTD